MFGEGDPVASHANSALDSSSNTELLGPFVTTGGTKTKFEHALEIISNK